MTIGIFGNFKTSMTGILRMEPGQRRKRRTIDALRERSITFHVKPDVADPSQATGCEGRSGDTAAVGLEPRRGGPFFNRYTGH